MSDLAPPSERLRGAFRGLNMGSNKEAIFGASLGECVGTAWGAKTGVPILGAYAGAMSEAHYAVTCLYTRVQKIATQIAAPTTVLRRAFTMVLTRNQYKLLVWLKLLLKNNGEFHKKHSGIPLTLQYQLCWKKIHKGGGRDSPESFVPQCEVEAVISRRSITYVNYHYTWEWIQNW